MPLFLASALAASVAATPACSWDRPGFNPFTGGLPEAVDGYTDIPATTRSRLRQRVATREYDDLVTISRDAINGRHSYLPEMRDMHFGNGRVCATVTRSRWPDGAQERGLVYCEAEHCIIVPTVCRNVSRVTRQAARPAALLGASAGHGQLGSLPAPAAWAPAAPLLPLAPPAGDLLPGVVASLPGTALPAVPTVPPAARPVPWPISPWPGPSGGGGTFLPAPAPPIPEPGSAWTMLAGGGVLGWMLMRRRRRNPPP